MLDLFVGGGLEVFSCFFGSDDDVEEAAKLKVRFGLFSDCGPELDDSSSSVWSAQLGFSRRCLHNKSSLLHGRFDF